MTAAAHRSAAARSGLALAAAATLLAPANASAQTELLFNPGFEQGSVNPWFASGPAALSISSDGRTGDFAAEITGRTNSWNAPNQNIGFLIESGRAYEYGVWVKVLGLSPQSVSITLRIDDALGERFVRVAEATGEPGQWVRVSGYRSVSLVEPVSAVQFYVEGPSPGVSYRIDDATVTPIDGYDWRTEAQAGIEAHRMNDLAVTVLDQNGEPRDDAAVRITQTEREFRFGSAISAGELANAQYAEYFRQRFNMATPENSWKWPATEGFPNFEFYGNADAIRDFCVANNIKIHGHNVVWSVQQYVPGWVQNLSGAALLQAVDERVQSVVSRYDDVTDAWDVNNEMLHGSFFADRLGEQFRADLFNMVRAVDDDVPLYINDYSIITSTELEPYLKQYHDLVARGAEINGIGVQGHYNNAVDPFVLRAQLDRLGSTGLPIRVTEYDYERPGASDAERADSLETMYRVAFSHPSIDAISLWGFWAGRHWRGEEAALVEFNWTINEVGERLDDLLEEWTTNLELPADNQGVVSARVFHGTHEVVAIGPDGAESAPSAVSVESQGGDVAIQIVLPRTPCQLVDVAAPAGTLNADDLTQYLTLFQTSPQIEADLDADSAETFLDVLHALELFENDCTSQP